jgi:DNA-binding transcriptional LysR family regulator
MRDTSLIARRIAPIRLAICAAPEYLARHGVPKIPDDLASHNCLEYTYFESRGEWRLLDSAGTETAVPVSGRYLANNADVLRSTAIAGGGNYLGPDLPGRRGLAIGASCPSAAKLSAAGAGAPRFVSTRSASLGKSANLCGLPRCSLWRRA